jgi:hypothetical protein
VNPELCVTRRLSSNARSARSVWIRCGVGARG